MPTVLRVGPYSFMFFAGDMDEPAHVHVRRERLRCKFWLVPEVSLSSNQGFAAHELNRIERLVAIHRDFLLERWHEFFHS